MNNSGNRDSRVTLKIPRPLYNQLKKIVENSGFSSVNEFTVYVLRDLVGIRGELGKETNNLSQEEIRLIRKHLQSLGYLG